MDVLSPFLGDQVELHLITHDRVAEREGVRVHSNIFPGDGTIQRILAESDLFALPTDMDMSPNAILEAMAAGLPVVAYATGAIPEMVEDGSTGFLVPVGNKRALLQALTRLIDSPSLRVGSALPDAHS